MNVNAVSSSLMGIAAAQSQMDTAANSAAHSGLIGDTPDTGGTGDLVDAVTGGVNAQLAQSVNIALLRRSMDMQQSIVDILA